MCTEPHILIVDQHLVAEAVKKLIELELGLNVLGIWADANRLFDAFDRLRPELILFHLHKPYAAELDCDRRLRAIYPCIEIGQDIGFGR